MNEDKDIVLRKQERRYKLLLEIWKTSDGKHHNSVNFFEIAKKAGFGKEMADEIYYYFRAEGFFSNMNFGGGVSLSHRAIVEIEKSLINPYQSTEHFSSTVIQNFHAPVSSVQIGNNNIANVNQNIGQNLSDILEHLANLKREFQSLPDEDREEAIEIVDALAVEVQSENPSKGKVKAFLSSVKDFAVKTGTDATSKIVVELIKSQIGIS